MLKAGFLSEGFVAWPVTALTLLRHQGWVSRSRFQLCAVLAGLVLPRPHSQFALLVFFCLVTYDRLW